MALCVYQLSMWISFLLQFAGLINDNNTYQRGILRKLKIVFWFTLEGRNILFVLQRSFDINYNFGLRILFE